jgi:sugar lactone lactonase YvrE
VAGGNGFGEGLHRLRSPYSLFIVNDQTVYIAEYSNDRIVEWNCGATSGLIIAGGNGEGKRSNQLNGPTDVIVDKENNCLLICDHNNKRVVKWPRQTCSSGETIISDVHCYGLTMDDTGYLYVSDHSKHEVRRWKIGDIAGTIVAGGNGKGERLYQLNSPTYIFVDKDHSVYVSDSDNNRVMKWMKDAKEGVVVAGGQGKGNNLSQLHHPGGIVVDQLGTVYVADHKNDRVMRWTKEDTQGSIVVGGNKCGGGSTQFNGSWNLSFDQQGNLYVIDYWNQRLQKFHIDPTSNK